MKNTYIAIIVLVLVILGFWFLGTGNKKVEAPEQTNSDQIGIINEEVAKEFTISGQNFSFTPSMITVKKGDKVKITFNNVDGFHDFVIDEYGVATKQAKSPYTEVVEFTADKVGSFEYYCSVGTHRAMGMKGTLKVE